VLDADDRAAGRFVQRLVAIADRRGFVCLARACGRLVQRGSRLLPLTTPRAECDKDLTLSQAGSALAQWASVRERLGSTQCGQLVDLTGAREFAWGDCDAVILCGALCNVIRVRPTAASQVRARSTDGRRPAAVCAVVAPLASAQL